MRGSNGGLLAAIIETMEAGKPLETRIFRHKKAKTKFFCPLCRTSRVFKLSPRISRGHWVQITMTSIVITILTAQYLGVVSLASFFLVWGIFELILRMLFRREIPCPHCGFDASWYQRDIKVARRLVAEFWDGKGGPEPTKNEELPLQ